MTTKQRFKLAFKFIVVVFLGYILGNAFLPKYQLIIIKKEVPLYINKEVVHEI